MLILIMVAVLPVLLDDLHTRMLTWGIKGTINSFKEVFDVCLVLSLHQPPFLQAIQARIPNDRALGNMPGTSSG